MGTLSSLIKNWNSETYWKELDYSSFGIQGTCIVLQTCIGSVAAAYSLSAGALVALSLVTISNIVANALIISQSPLKWIVASSVITIITSIVVTVYVLSV